jgi:hypothetical protein
MTLLGRRYLIPFWALALLLTPAAVAQISPGPLARAHRDLEGPTKCTTCHNFGLGNRGFKCLECHTEIAGRIERMRGYHARAYNVSRGQVDCARCHLEHNGLQFQITKLDRKTFSHDGLTDFPLLGKHKTITCEDCHNPKYIEAPARSEIKIKDLRKTFLGLPTECATCHKDPHAGQFTAPCQSCHSQDVWKPAAGFDHNRTVYPLTGKHQTTDCAKCHPTAAGSTVVRYKGLSFSGCQNCHADPHKGAFEEATFKGNCETCHTTADWKAVRNDSGFNHDQTKFPLRGKHAETGCFKCHKTSDFKEPVPYERCGDCHEDVHRGQFVSRAGGDDCKACHNETVFKPSTYTLELHQTSAFPLKDKHAPLACEKCHFAAGQDTQYRLGTLTCIGCHADPHAGEFAYEKYNNDCEACHSQQAFLPSSFAVAKHAETKFVLSGAHIAVLCGDCHMTMPGAVSEKARQYHVSGDTCTACHTDPHHTKETCDTCHNVRQWKELRVYDHSQTRFPLEGAHQTATCEGCHKPVQPPADPKVKATVDFARTPRECFECHEDIHGGQFMTGGKELDCTTCHSVNKWSLASFDHDKTSFPLEGAHDKVSCAQCHRERVEHEGKQIRQYRGTPSQCSDCHANIGK